ncbi:MAG: archaeosortase A [Euryarchaeota archaeon]|nr:archaeosortase A [Euryarchaeota archaeon]
MIILWISLILLLMATIMPRHKNVVGGSGWMFFAAHWALQPLHYLGKADVFNAVLTILVCMFCMSMAFFNLKNKSDTLLTITCAAVIGGLLYFPFAEMSLLNNWLIGAVASQTVWGLNLLGAPATQLGNYIWLNGYDIEIILACTGIESMALFTGVTFAVDVPPMRRLRAFLASVPLIYALNIIRNMFVMAAYGYQWFGEHSFYIAHHVLAKMGSTIALFLIAYVVLLILPEVVDMIADLARMFRRG